MRAKATIFDGGEATRDRNGLLFSEKWAADGHGEWCYGTVSFVYARRGRHAQLYRVKYDEGTVMQAEDAHLELAEDEEDSDDESENELGGSEAENSNDETVYEEQVGGFRIGERAEPRGGDVEEDVGGNVTEDSEGGPRENNPGNLLNAMEPLGIGDTVEAHGKTWKRVEGLTEDARTEPVEASKSKRLHYNESTREVDIFWQLMPLTKEDLLQIVREGAQTARDRRQ